jgi:hypothetical protein
MMPFAELFLHSSLDRVVMSIVLASLVNKHTTKQICSLRNPWQAHKAAQAMNGKNDERNINKALSLLCKIFAEC